MALILLSLILQAVTPRCHSSNLIARPAIASSISIMALLVPSRLEYVGKTQLTCPPSVPFKPSLLLAAPRYLPFAEGGS
ncbi:hypothetical protein QE435_002087 [Rhizobium sp. SORGH_AS 787]|uniref:Secreted protein n=1 Tax=Agrobacterium larrymoorei TaxID=160699 RepID=A0ABU0UPF3_9HYPH|nr:hypothetical protein [Agrobacterium larrymoorei]MDQ1196377.1 hypothetical protein [Rhizobium sp. SORGH_AS_0787]